MDKVEKNQFKNSGERERERKREQNWTWLKIFFWLLFFISIGLLVGEIWSIQQQKKKLQELVQQDQQTREKYHLQQQHLISLNSLANKAEISEFFSDLLITYAEKFSQSKNLDISHLPLTFGGFYQEQENNSKSRGLGRCFLEKDIYPQPEKRSIISLNQLYLLNKFGHDYYFASYPLGEYFVLDISFRSMLETCAHELAHYLQQVKHDGKSSCASDLKLQKDKYNPVLAQEHKERTAEIYQLIKQDYSVWEEKWKNI